MGTQNEKSSSELTLEGSVIHRISQLRGYALTPYRQGSSDDTRTTLWPESRETRPGLHALKLASVHFRKLLQGILGITSSKAPFRRTTWKVTKLFTCFLLLQPRKTPVK